MGCEVEVEQACAWFGEQLFEPNEQRQIFVDRLKGLLTTRYEGHWYPEEPHRGCAYRALLSTVNQLDPLLLRAAESTGQRGLFESFNRVFADVGEVNCWINPGEVKVIRGRAQQIIYSDGNGSDNPYEKLRVKIEPTRLAVKVDPVEYVPSSPVSSHNGSQSGMGGGEGGGFSTFVRGAKSHGGSSSHDMSQSQSPTESPMQSWSSGGNGGLPAMAPLPPHMGNAGNGGFGSGVFGQGFGGDQGGFAPGFSQGLDGSSAMGGSFGGLAGAGGGMGGGNGMGGGFGGGAGNLQQQQQPPPPPQQQPPVSSAGPHGASPMRPGYFGGGSNSFGSTPVF